MHKKEQQVYTNILLSQIENVEESLYAKYLSNGLKNHLETGSCYNGNGTVEAFLSFNPQNNIGDESIDLTMSLSCTERGAVFSSEILWSSGKMIDEVVVCEICPDCLDDLDEDVEHLMDRNRGPIVHRMVDLFDNFYLPSPS